MATGARCGGERQGIDGRRQLLRFTNSVEMPRPLLSPVILASGATWAMSVQQRGYVPPLANLRSHGNARR